MKTFWLYLLLAAISLDFSKAEDARIPIEPISGSIASYVDKDGYVNPIIDLGNINFGGGLTLPLVLNFSSAIRAPSPEFGQGWECPLFEAKIFDVKQDEKSWETLGGKTRYLIYNKRTGSWKHFYTDDWTGNVAGDHFELTYKTGTKFIFDKGLISSLTTPDGRTILWNRLGDKLISLQEVGKSPALRITYDKLGFAKQLLLNPDSLGATKNSYTFTSSLIYAGVSKILSSQGRIIAFDRSRDKSLNPILNWSDTLHSPQNIGWDSKTGKILKDRDYTYNIVELNKDKTWPKMERINIATKRTERFFFDQIRGTTDETLADGTMRHIEMIQAPGPNYKAVRLIEDTKNGKTQIVLRRAFDAQGHLLQEAIGLTKGGSQVKQYIYDEAGRVTDYLLNGKEVWKNIYDPGTGQLCERDAMSLGVKIVFEQLPGGDVREAIKRSGNPEDIKQFNANDWQAAVTSMQRID